ncbi:MAG TPA: DUF423 domain-containing protein [Gemmatimonadales bacterium]|nr:DUF423 domain-containing protein [Gemmatimonadales bacterium]
MSRLFLVIGAVFGFLGVAAGAFAAHALRGMIPPDLLAVFETGARYQMYHGLALLAVAWLSSQMPSRWITASGWLFVVGTVLFSGSLYALALTSNNRLGMITPFGGVALLAGWASLGIGAWQGRRSEPS